jgi:oligopeptidase A
MQPKVVGASLRIGQSRPVYDALVGLMENQDAWAALTPAQRRAVECEVRDSKLGGVAGPPVHVQCSWTYSFQFNP